MSTSTPVKTAGTVLLTTQQIQSNTVVVGSAVDLSGKLAAQIFVNAGRVPTGSLVSGNAPVFTLQGLSGGTNWVPIYTWTTANHIYVANAQTMTSNAAAGAVTLQLSAALGSALSAPILVYDSATPANSEWTWQQQASTNPTLNQSLANAHNSGSGILVSHAEQWSFPIDTSGITSVRFVVNNVWNAVAAPYMVQATINTLDNITTV